MKRFKKTTERPMPIAAVEKPTEKKQGVREEIADMKAIISKCVDAAEIADKRLDKHTVAIKTTRDLYIIQSKNLDINNGLIVGHKNKLEVLVSRMNEIEKKMRDRSSAATFVTESFGKEVADIRRYTKAKYSTYDARFRDLNDHTFDNKKKINEAAIKSADRYVIFSKGVNAKLDLYMIGSTVYALVLTIAVLYLWDK